MTQLNRLLILAALYFLSSISFLIQAQNISTIAGIGSPINGFSGDGGLATKATLGYPDAIAFDAAGNKYIADTWNNRIRKIDLNGMITTYAGKGSQGYSGDGLLATKAELNGPNALVIDTSGNLYISDANNFCIRKVDAKGFITTVVGGGINGLGDGGPATSAQLQFPYGVTLDAIGNLYIADFSDHRIRKVDRNGIITTVAGNGTAGYNGDNILAVNAELNYPAGVAVDAKGNLYISDNTNQLIRKVDTDGVITTIAGTKGVKSFSGDGGLATKATLKYPCGITLDALGNIIFSDQNNYRIRKINATDGTISTIAGNGYGFGGDGGLATKALLATPYGVSFDGAGNLYIGDHGNNCIREVTYLSITSFTPTTACVGSIVTVKGVGFSTANAVTIGGAPAASYSIISDSVITFIAGTADSGKLSVTNTGGNFTFNKALNLLKPSATTINQSACGSFYWHGTSYTISGSYTFDTTNAVGCDSLVTLNLTITICLPNYVWTGATNKDWNDASNWSNNVLPADTSSVSIPSTAINQPVLSADVMVNNIKLDGQLSLNDKALTINGAVSGSGSLIGSAASSLIVGGTAGTISFSPSANSLNYLTVIGTATLGDTLNLFGTLSVPIGGTFNTGGKLILKSSNAGTAVVGPVGGSISGNATIERYIPFGYAAYRDLGVCVSGAGSLDNTWGTVLNNYPTYTYDVATGWNTFAGSGTLQPYTGYRILVTGYKNTVVPTTTISQMNSDVTLNYTGSLLTGNQSVPLASGVDKFSFIANPYASQVDFNQLTTNGIYNGYWYLDPTTLYGTFENYNFYGANIGVSNIYAKSAAQYLQPGQAIFVCSNSASPSLTFTESAKDNTSPQQNIFGKPTLNRIALGLFTNNKNVDGAVVVFNNNFSKNISQEDGLKINNQGENLTFTVAGKELCANGWTLPIASDELPLHLFNLNANTTYQLRLDASLFVGNGVNAYLKDNVLKTGFLLVGDSNVVSFTTSTDTASYGNRYSIVFDGGFLPVENISLSANMLENKQVAIRWTVTGETNVVQYQLERSLDGVRFTNLATVVPTILNNYGFTDASLPSRGAVYYRVKAIDNTGKLSYSNVASLTTNNSSLTTITAYPNPIKGNTFSLNLNNLVAGKYAISIINKLGQVAYTSVLNHSIINATESIYLDKELAAGSYTIVLKSAANKVFSTEVMVK